MVAVTRGQRAGLGLEFLQGVRERHRQVQVIERIVVGATVHQVRHPGRQASGYRDRDGRIVLVRIQISGRSRCRRAGKKNQFRRHPAVER